MKGRDEFNFQVKGDLNAADALVQSFLQANGFSLHEKKGEQYYRAGDAMLGYRGFTYKFQGQTIYISAWLDAVTGNVKMGKNSLNIASMSYRNILNKLFTEIANLDNGGINMNNQRDFENNASQPVNETNQFAQKFQAETDKKKEIMCEIGFWVSIVGVLLSLTGTTFGVLIYILEFYFASQGLKTRKRGKAIATIVLASVSIVVTIVLVVLAALLL